MLTNHHVAADTLSKISTAEHNYYRDGFFAITHADEVGMLEAMRKIYDAGTLADELGK